MISIRWQPLSALTIPMALVIGLTPTVCAAQPPSAAPKYAEWSLIAKSDLILRAKLIAPVDAIRASTTAGKYSYVSLRAVPVEVLKGNPGATEVEVRYYTAPESYSPSPHLVIDLNRKEVLLFLLRVDEPGRAELYFAGYTPRALRAFDEATAKAVRAEVQNQQRILAAYPHSGDARPDAHHAEVHAILQQMLDKQTQMAAYQKLERLGQAAVPSMIRLMDDRRPLATPYIAFRNKSPAAFEAYAQYSPELMVDAVASLLGYITGEEFGHLDNGGSERERARTVESWRIYLHYQLGKSTHSNRVSPG